MRGKAWQGVLLVMVPTGCSLPWSRLIRAGSNAQSDMQAEKRQQEQLEQRNSGRELSQELPSLPAAAQAGPQQQAPPSAKVIRHTAQHSRKEGRTSSHSPPVTRQSRGRMPSPQCSMCMMHLHP